MLARAFIPMLSTGTEEMAQATQPGILPDSSPIAAPDTEIRPVTSSATNRHAFGPEASGDLRGHVSQSTTESFVFAPGPIRGRVFDPRGNPLKFFSVRLTPVGTSSKGQTTQRGRDGRFQLEAVVPGQYRIKIRHHSYLPQSHRIDVRADRSGEESSRELVIHLLEGGLIRGRVISESGAAQGAVSVIAYPKSPRPDAGAVTTPSSPMVAAPAQDTGMRTVVTASSKDGTFALPRLEPGTWTLVARKKGWGESIPQSVNLQGVQTTDERTLVLRPGGHIVGRVLLEDGTEAADAMIELRVEEAPPREPTAPSTERISMTRTRTDRWGRFEFMVARPGSYRLKVNHSEELPDAQDVYLARGLRRRGICKVTVELGNTSQVDVVLPGRTAIPVQGRVHFNGEPASDLRIDFRDPERPDGWSSQVGTDVDGCFATLLPDQTEVRVSIASEYRAAWLDPQGAYVTLSEPYHPPSGVDCAELSFRTGKGDLNIDLAVGGLRGTVVGADGPLGGLEVKLTPSGPMRTEPHSVGFALTSPTGVFAFQRVLEGSYVLSVAQEPQGVEASCAVRVSAREVLDGISLSLPFAGESR